jgi:hypothetical protein
MVSGHWKESTDVQTRYIYIYIYIRLTEKYIIGCLSMFPYLNMTKFQVAKNKTKDSCLSELITYQVLIRLFIIIRLNIYFIHALGLLG